MKIKALCDFLESYAPLAYQEDYDNSGLIVGSPDTELIKGVVCLDCTEAVVDGNLNDPVSVIKPVYKQVAISRLIKLLCPDCTIKS